MLIAVQQLRSVVSLLRKPAAARVGGLLALALATAVVCPLPARAVIIYVCPDHNLCRVNSDGTGQRHLTSDATATDNWYSSPSLSRDGTKLGFIEANSAYTSAPDATQRVNLRLGTALNDGPNLMVVMRADGGRIAVIWNRFEATFNQYTPYLAEMNLDSTNFNVERRAALTAGYLGTAPLSDGYSATGHSCSAGTGNCPAYSVCTLDTSSGDCVRNVADDPARDLWDPAGSPDGSMIAATAIPYPEGNEHASPSGGDIALYNAATGNLIRNLTTGPHDSQPAWSPDGKQIAFTHGNAIYLISSNPSGTPRLLVAGTSPTWGGADIHSTPPPPRAPVISKSTLSSKQHTARFRFAAQGIVTGYQCALNKLPASPHGKVPSLHLTACKSPKLYSKLRIGKYEFAVRAVGPGGNSVVTLHNFKL